MNSLENRQTRAANYLSVDRDGNRFKYRVYNISYNICQCPNGFKVF